MPFRIVIGPDWHRKPGQEDIEPKEYSANDERELKKILMEYGGLKVDDVGWVLEEARSAREVNVKRKTGMIITIYSKR